MSIKGSKKRKDQRRKGAWERCDHSAVERVDNRDVRVKGGAFKNGRCTKCGMPG